MTEEVQVVPKWLKELEDKRERRLKVRLGHEAGAGSPCLTCEDKCPGLDLHFWRKICKNCKCGKESHDVNDDDIYGWAQFQLLGSKPNKPKKIVLPGQGDEVELEWTPKGQSDVVESYLKHVPINLLPIKGSPAAQERKQLLQKQIPLHDIDPSLCHALSEFEVSKMNDYIAHVKQDSVGMGHIIKLNELLKSKLASSQLLANRGPMQVPQIENIALQGSNRSHVLENLNSNRQKLLNIQEDSQIPFNANINDVNYGVNQSPVSGGKFQQNNPRPSVNNRVDHQNLANIGMRDINYPLHSQNYGVPGSIRYTNEELSNSGAIRDGNLPGVENPQNYGVPGSVRYGTEELTKNMENLKMLPNYAQKTLNNEESVQTPVNANAMRDIYPDHFNQNDPRSTENLQTVPNYGHQTITNDENFQNPFNSNTVRNRYNQNDPQNMGHFKNLPNYAQNSLSNDENVQFPVNSNSIRNVYPDHLNQNDPKNMGNPKNLPNYAQSTLTGDENVQVPVHSNAIRNVYPDHLNQNDPKNMGNPKNLPNYAQSTLTGDENVQVPVNSNAIRNVYPDHLNQNDDLQFNPLTNANLPHRAATSHTSYDEEQNPQNFSNLKDLAYSTYHPNAPRPANLPTQQFNPHLHPTEQNVNPICVTVGSIQDIEYPNIKAAILNQMDPETPNQPNKSFTLDDLPDALPACRNCKTMFHKNAIVIGVDHTEALWHAECFKCHGCNHNLADLMYFYDQESDNVYCGRDYAKIRGIPRCCACDELIFVKEYCLAENSTFHVKHFCCYECDKPLAGQNYLMEDSQPLCLPCYEQIKAEKCSACGKVIKADEQNAKLMDVHFHADDNCFCCKVCRKALLGAKFLFKNNILYCSSVCFNAGK